MRPFVLIAAIALASTAAAQAGESRSLSGSNPSDLPAATQPRNNVRADNTANTTPAPVETPRYAPPPAETSQPADATRNSSDTPRYTARPAAVDTATPTSSERAYHRPARYRQAQMQRRPHRGRLVGRVIAALHRYGIYW
jgi:hypothetical protein